MTILDALNGGGSIPLALDPTSLANSISRSLDQQVANLRAGANNRNSPSLNNPANQPQDPLALLQQQLFAQINAIPTYSTPIDQLRAQAQQQVNATYDPQIAQIQQGMKTTTGNAHTSESQAKDMYNSLAQSLAAEIPNITHQMSQARNDTNSRYQQAQQQSQQDYSQQAHQQQAVLSQLGLQSAQQATSVQGSADQNYFQNQENLQKNASLDALQQQGQNAQNYQQNSSDTSRLAGANAATDLEKQLQDYLAKANGQVGTLQAQKSSGLQTVLQQLMNSDAKNSQTQHQTQLDNLMKMFNFQLSAQKAMNSNANAANNNQLFKGTSGPTGAANSLAQSLGPDRSNTAQQILQLINNTMSDPNVVAGKHAQTDSKGNPLTDPVTRRPVTVSNNDQYIEDLLRSKMENVPGSAYQTSDINSAINALLAYLGKLR